MKRYRILLPALALLVLAIGWSIFWVVASRSVGDALAQWYGREKQAQRVWSCPDQSIGGYPFRIIVTCSKPTFSGLFTGEQAEGSLAGFRAVAQVYQPNNIIVEADEPLIVRMPMAGREARLDWSHFRVGVRAAPGALQRASAVMDAPALAVSGFGPISARKAEAHIRRTPPSEPQRGHDIALSLVGLKAADPMLAKAGDIDLDLLATVTKGESLLDAGPLAQRLDAFQQAAGRVHVTGFKLVQGGSRIEARAELAIDDQRRLSGWVDIDKAGLQALVARFGVKPEMVELGGAVAPGEPLRADGPRTVRLRLQDGRVTLGPVVLPVRLPALY